MALVLMLLAVPLSKLRPRQGRFARVGLAVLAYFLYSNLLSAVRIWIQKDAPGGAARAVVGAPDPARDRRLAGMARRAARLVALAVGAACRGGREMNVLGNYIIRTVLRLHGARARWC